MTAEASQPRWEEPVPQSQVSAAARPN